MTANLRKVHRGVNLAVRDVKCSDPYVVIKMGKQVKKDLSYFELTHNCTPKLNMLVFRPLKTTIGLT